MDLFELVKSDEADKIRGVMWTAEELNRRDELGRTALMYAAMRGKYKIIESLKSAGADVNITDKAGLKAVHHAANNGHGMSVIYLIEGGCGA